MDEAAAASLLRHVIATEQAADLLDALTGGDLLVLRTDADSFVLVEANPFGILVSEANR